MDNLQANNYSNYTETDFINDSFFQEWIIRPENETEIFWSNFLMLHPGKREPLERAAFFLKHLRFEEHLPSDDYVHQCYLEHLEQVKSARKRTIAGINQKTIRRLVSAAAFIGSIVMIATVINIFNSQRNNETAVVTKYGEIKNVFLPDGSTIVLNANSKITFRKSWDEDEPREIWLNGEAFFDVKRMIKDNKKAKPYERFLIHGNDFTIEVLGTSFDIRQRRGKTEVVLQSGKIKLTLHDASHNGIVMNPGDLVSYDPAENKVIQSKIEPENYSGWKKKKLMLTDPTLEQIINYLEDNYGKKIVLEDRDLKSKKIEGPIDLNSLDDALFIISTVLNIDIERKDSLILLHSK